MRRTFSLIMAFCMIFIMCSCGSQPEAEVIPQYDSADSDSDADLLGYEYKIAAITHGSVYPLNPVSGDTARGDKLLQRYKETEEKFNCKINILDGSDIATFLAYYAANIKYADLMFNAIHQVITGKYLQNGYFAPFSDMDSVGAVRSSRCSGSRKFQWGLLFHHRILLGFSRSRYRACNVVQPESNIKLSAGISPRA